MVVSVRTNIVDKGTVYKDHGPEHVVHSIQFGPDNVHVAIDEVIIGDIYIPIPNRDKLCTIKSAHKSLISWPKSLVIYGEDVVMLL